MENHVDEQWSWKINEQCLDGEDRHTRGLATSSRHRVKEHDRESTERRKIHIGKSAQHILCATRV